MKPHTCSRKERAWPPLNQAQMRPTRKRRSPLSTAQRLLHMKRNSILMIRMATTPTRLLTVATTQMIMRAPNYILSRPKIKASQLQMKKANSLTVLMAATPAPHRSLSTVVTTPTTMRPHKQDSITVLMAAARAAALPTL